MTESRHPLITELPRAECIALLERNHVGRLAFTFHDRVDIEPISYAYANGWLYARTSDGTKLVTVHHHPWVAFEVDEVRGHFDWQSVVVRSTIYFLDANADRDAYQRAVDALRPVDPHLLEPEDATPQRRHLFGIHVDEMTGRQARSL
ncbi:MAG TPA: pyridoxamine 5'-phosphate oxidase family protein [Gemmatimonadaceae bacterium]|jgi:hypothetical protein|nr:pyridoxamine 5'-phosphate oxidase family protein [Gemmatimonadaceae bacterium]